MTSRDELARMISEARQPRGPVGKFAQAKLLSWDPNTWANSVEWRGDTYTNLPVKAAVDALTYTPGAEVVLEGIDLRGDGATTSWWIAGRVVRPGAGNAEAAIAFLQTTLVKSIIDEIVQELLNSPAGTTLINGIVEDLLVSPAGQELAAFVIGQRVHVAEVATGQGTSSTSFTDLATAGPSVSGVSISDAGKALVMVTSNLAASSQIGALEFQQAEMAYSISGATSRSASGTDAVMLFHGNTNGTSGTNVRATAVSVATGLNAGTHTFTAKYRKALGDGTVNFANRNITVIAF